MQNQNLQNERTEHGIGCTNKIPGGTNHETKRSKRKATGKAGEGTLADMASSAGPDVTARTGGRKNHAFGRSARKRDDLGRRGYCRDRNHDCQRFDGREDEGKENAMGNLHNTVLCSHAFARKSAVLWSGLWKYLEHFMHGACHRNHRKFCRRVAKKETEIRVIDFGKTQENLQN